MLPYMYPSHQIMQLKSERHDAGKGGPHGGRQYKGMNLTHLELQNKYLSMGTMCGEERFKENMYADTDTNYDKNIFWEMNTDPLKSWNNSVMYLEVPGTIIILDPQQLKDFFKDFFHLVFWNRNRPSQEHLLKYWVIISFENILPSTWLRLQNIYWMNEFISIALHALSVFWSFCSFIHLNNDTVIS